MILYYSRHQFMLLMTLVRHKTHKTLKTLKSRNDEQNNQALLGRLKNIAVIGEKRTTLPPSASKIVLKDNSSSSSQTPERKLTTQKLNKLVSYYQSDPLTWNASVLGRIYNVPENYCKQVIDYVRPMIFYISQTYEEPLQITAQRIVVDVARLRSDENYLVNYKKIVFPKRGEKLPVKALA